MSVSDERKKAAAEAAVALVRPGNVVGLGTGSTAAFAIAALIREARNGLDILCIPTSDRSAEQARAGGLRLEEEPVAAAQIDITIDGTDEVVRGSLNLIKGLGGALLREKIVAAATKRLVIIADDSKLVDRLGQRTPVPVEVVRFGWRSTWGRIEALGGVPVRRLAKDGSPFITDGGNYILDAKALRIPAPEALGAALKNIAGVVEHGLFMGLARVVIIGKAKGADVRTL